MLFDTSGSVELDMKAYADPAQGGTATVSPQTAAAGQTVTFTAQAEEDYHFTGWYNLVGEKVSDQATYAVEADSCLTLIAKFSNEAPHTHTVTLVKGTPATCTQDGVKDYYWCSCGAAFEDEAMTKPIHDLDAWKVIPATKAVTDIPMEDHQYVDGVCTVCGAKDPDYVEPTQQPQATDKPAATQQPDTVPPTGDAGQLMVYVAAMGAAALLMGAAVAVRKRKEG